MKISLTDLTTADENSVSLAGSISLLTARNRIASLYFRREKRLIGETHNTKHVNLAKGSKPLRELSLV